VSEERIAELSEALHRHRGNSLVVSGDNDLGAQVAVALLNRLLGNEGNTLDLDRPTRVHGDSDGDLVDLLAAVQSGEVGALIVVGLDPVDQLPRGAELTAALAEIPLSVAITDRPTATADASQIVAASHHGLECWGDARPRSDVLTLAQPTIQPLFDTRHPYENFLVWSEAPTTDYLQHLRGTWRDTFALEHAGFEDFWARSVAAGAAVAEVPTPPPPAPAPDLVEGEETPPEADAPDAGNLRWAAVEAALATMGATGDGELEIDVIGEVGLRGGRRAHIPWLRELPDPLTRVSWTPVVRIAPDLAREMGVEDGDVIDIEASDNQLTLPVRIMPGQHPRVLGVPVGYGRQDGDLGRAERNGSLLTLLAGERWIQRGIAASARSTGGHEDLPLVQIHTTSITVRSRASGPSRIRTRSAGRW
jgi:molybdopterin-containing oxidoreductase family iron-sulfur binding subunit